jgi:hypothetical protein
MCLTRNPAVGIASWKYLLLLSYIPLCRPQAADASPLVSPMPSALLLRSIAEL